MSQNELIKAKMALYIGNVEKNTTISAEKKRQLKAALQEIELQSNGNYGDFEDNILCDI